MQGKNSIIVESSKKRYLEMLSKGLNAYFGNGYDKNVYHKLNLQPHNYVVVSTDSEIKNTEICQMLKVDLGHHKIISKTSTGHIEKQLRDLQVEYVDVTRVMATTIENLILRPSTYHMLVETFENYKVEDITITNSGISGTQIKELPFHRDGELILVRRGHTVMIPHGDTYLQHNDIITVMGTEAALQDFREKFRSSMAQ